MNDLLHKLINIDPSKECLKFLANRIQSDNYRGIHLSQHYRYNMDDVIIILKELYDIAGTDLIRIRTTDISKRPYNYPEEQDYAILVDRIHKQMEKIGQDSLRKNMFPDMHRMGLIYRYDKNGNRKDPYENGGKYYVSITDIGQKMCSKDLTYFQKYNLYTEAINRLTQNLPDVLLEIMNDNRYIYEDEFMFFVTFIGCTIDGQKYYTSDCINEYVKEYRSLSRAQKIEINRLVAEYCNPSNFLGNKTNKRDYSNWKNETQQIFGLLSQTIYYCFDQPNERLSLRIDKNLLFDDTSKLSRSIEEKQEYFRKHKISKTMGFELHHVVPLCSAMTKNEYKILDCWKNMIYIDGFTHAKITVQNNTHMVLDFSDGNAILKQIAGNENNQILCVKDENILYNLDNQRIMKEYNERLIFGHYES